MLSVRGSNSLKKEFTVRVSSGPIDRFEISGLPDSLTAGIPYQITYGFWTIMETAPRDFPPVDGHQSRILEKIVQLACGLETLSFTKSGKNLFFTIKMVWDIVEPLVLLIFSWPPSRFF